MKKGENIVKYTAAQLKAKRGESVTDLEKLDAMTEQQLENLISEEEKDVRPDWTRAKLILPRAKSSVHLRLDDDIIDFYKEQGRGHISRMQAVLKAFADSQKAHLPK